MGDKADYEKQTLEFAKRLRLSCVNMNSGLKPYNWQLLLNFSASASEMGADFHRDGLRVNNANDFAPISCAFTGAFDTPPLTLT